MPSAYDTYYQAALKNIMPTMNAALEQGRAGLVDQGLLSSTAGQGKLGDLRGAYTAQANTLAQNQANTDRSFAESQRQFNSQQAARTYELLMSGALQRYALASKKPTGKWYPSDPRSFRYYERFKGDPVEQQIGDPREQWTRQAADWGPSQASVNAEMQATDAAAGRELQRQELALRARQVALAENAYKDEQKLANDPWALAMNDTTTAITTDADPNVSGIQRAINPSDVIRSIEGQYQVDIAEGVRQANPRAIRILQLLYPKTWKTRMMRAMNGEPLWSTDAEASAPLSTESVMGRVQSSQDNYTPNPAAMQYGYDTVSPAAYNGNMRGFPLVNPNPFR